MKAENSQKNAPQFHRFQDPLLLFLSTIRRAIRSELSMDQLRKEAREVLQRNPWNRPGFLRAAFEATAKNGLPELWQDVSSHDSTVHLDVPIHAILLEL